MKIRWSQHFPSLSSQWQVQYFRLVVPHGLCVPPVVCTSRDQSFVCLFIGFISALQHISLTSEQDRTKIPPSLLSTLSCNWDTSARMESTANSEVLFLASRFQYDSVSAAFLLRSNRPGVYQQTTVTSQYFHGESPSRNPAFKVLTDAPVPHLKSQC